ncbi:MAG TPA: response regulator [Candidatus Omnitrophota bacterium]|nr:response regulator [Candidatus Omnitrophota bacterium]HPB68945.1 response regulator [Candidatus Omnitrophota bacterium]HQO58685.1 response regulator [Candidatus Omnitrophota bacterium]
MSKKILVTDDNKRITDLLGKMLSMKGYEVMAAESGQDAIMKARSFAPDLVIMDLMLPDMQGSEVVRELKSQPAFAATPIIFLSGIAEDSDSGSCSTLQVDGVVYKSFAKPFDIEKFSREIEKSLS